MALTVPFDGSPLSKAAVVRATQFATVLEEEEVVVVSAIPKNNTQYARERGWIGPDELFDAETVVEHLRTEVTNLVPDATFEYLVVNKRAPRATIARRLREFIRAQETSIVFIGSEHGGRLIWQSSVGQLVATDSSHDTFIVSNEMLPKIAKLEEELPSDEVLP